MKSICPKCGFYMLDNNCPRCGYQSYSPYDDKYKNEITDLEFFLKGDYKKIVFNKNLSLIILLGTLYFAYYRFYLPSLILSILELSIHYIMGRNLGNGLGSILFFLIFTLDIIILRTIYATFFNSLLLNLANKRLSKIKKKDNYQEEIYKYEPHSILPPIIIILTFILIILIINIISSLK